MFASIVKRSFPDDENKVGVPLKGSIRVPLRVSLKGSIGFESLGFRLMI